MRIKIKQTCPYCHGFGYGTNIKTGEHDKCTSCDGAGVLIRWWDVLDIEGLEEVVTQIVEKHFIADRRL